MVKNNNKNIRTMSMTTERRLLLLWTYLSPSFSVSIFDFKEVNVSWAVSSMTQFPVIRSNFSSRKMYFLEGGRKN